jgi:hypothetical protein
LNLVSRLQLAWSFESSKTMKENAAAHSDIESEQDIALIDDASSLEGTRWAVGTAASASAVLS